MSATSRRNFRTTSDFLAALNARSGGTDSQHIFNLSLSMDCGDASSDDGEQLNTPVSDSAQLVEVAYPPGLSNTFPLSDNLDERATAASNSHCSSTEQSCFSSSKRSADSLAFEDFLSASPVSSLSSPSDASPLLDRSILCSTTLLDTRISLEDSSLDLYLSSTDSALPPLRSPQKSRSVDIAPAYHAQISNENSMPLRSSPPRKRPSDTQSPLTSYRGGQKPKLACVASPGFLPSTLGTSYCDRFPKNYRLRTDFVRTYALDAELGSGGYGFVMTARHRREGHEVAVKFISKDRIPRYGWARDEYGKKVPKEAWFLSKLNHPAIVKFYDLFEDDIFFYVIMELHGTPWVKRQSALANGSQASQQSRNMEENVLTTNTCVAGGSKPSKIPKHTKGPLARPMFARRASHDLFECIEQSKHKRFSEDDAKYIFAQVVDVVDYLDQLGITHCDIKDENVVVDKDLKIKLVDFGSVVSTDATQERPFYTTFYGTAAYASPEVIRNQPYQAPPAEIWAIGVLLSFLITGSSPFPTEDDKRNGRIVLDAPSRKRISAECFHLLQRCLEVDPGCRADIAEVKTHPWLSVGFEKLYADRL